VEDPGENIRRVLNQVLDKDDVNRLWPTRHRTESVFILFQHSSEISSSTAGWNYYVTVREQVIRALKQHFI